MKYLKLKKPLRKKERRRKKMKEGTRVASNERRLKKDKYLSVGKINMKKFIVDITSHFYNFH